MKKCVSCLLMLMFLVSCSTPRLVKTDSLEKEITFLAIKLIHTEKAPAFSLVDFRSSTGMTSQRSFKKSIREYRGIFNQISDLHKSGIIFYLETPKDIQIEFFACPDVPSKYQYACQ